MHRIVILGGGTGGTLVANRLRRHYRPDEATITVVDADDRHLYQPGLLFVPFGLVDPEEIVRSRSAQLRTGVHFRLAGIDRIDLEDEVVVLEDGTRLGYDVLVVATGVRLLPEETEGMVGPEWGMSVFTFYDLAGSTGLARALRRFEGGRLVVNLVDLPIKCPVAPLEFCFLADWWLREQGLREKTELVFATPLDGAFTRPTASALLGSLLEEKGVTLATEFNTGSVDAAARILRGYDGTEIPYDLLVTIPLHGGAACVGRSPGLGDGDLDFVPTDPRTLQSTVRPNVFAVGDATNLPTSKAGSVTHFEGEVLCDNIVRFLADEPLGGNYDGHANCFIETGFGKALMIDFNDETEPLPGRFPGRAGPFPLLRESRLNHLAKLMFQWFYWHLLLPGRDVPGLEPELSLAGKHLLAAREERR